MSESWRDNAACKTLGLKMFFADGEHASKEVDTRIDSAKNICSNCGVQVVCLSYALNNEIEYGIWGGFTGRERTSIKKIFDLQVYEESLVSQLINKTVHLIKAQVRRNNNEQAQE